MQSIKLALSAAIIFIAFAVEAEPNISPNILIIQVDDMGFDDLSINGNKQVNTVNIDSLARQSVQFSNFMVNSVCAPTRASTLTGRDFWRTGVEGLHGGKDFLHINETTFADVFQANGYATGMWGKWHNGKSDGYWPWDRGFDEAYAANLYKFFPSNGWYNQYPQKTVHKGKWSPEVLTDYTLDFMERNKSKPFLAYLSFLSVHEIWNTPDSYKKPFMEQGHSEKFSQLLGMLDYVDDQIGRILTYLESSGLDKNTVILFMSDNGPNRGRTKAKSKLSPISDAEWRLRNNSQFLGSKSNLWKNGLKSPLFIKWPNKFTPTKVDRLVTITDIFPTLLDIANIALPKDNLPLDGRSIKPYLLGDVQSLSAKQGVFTHWHPAWKGEHYAPIEDKNSLDFTLQRMTLITEKFKLIQNGRKVPNAPRVFRGNVLTDVNQDPLEKNNLAQNKPEQLQQMQLSLSAWFDGIKQAKHAFTPTVFQIGWQGKQNSEVPAFAPAKVHGVKNNSHVITGWDQVGDSAQYQLNVHKSGIYKVSIESSVKKVGATLSLKANSGASQSQGTIKHNNKKSVLTQLGEITLNKGSQTFNLEVTNRQAKGEFSPLALKTIHFEFINP